MSTSSRGSGATARGLKRRGTWRGEGRLAVYVYTQPTHTPTRAAPSFLLLAVLLLLVLLLLLLPDRIDAFAFPTAARTRRRSVSRTTTTSMTHTPPEHKDGEREQLSTRAHVLFQSAAAVTGGLLLGSATTSTSIGGVKEAQAALEPIVSQTYMEQVRDGAFLIAPSPPFLPPFLPPSLLRSVDTPSSLLVGR
jgi:hypothetical protein